MARWKVTAKHYIHAEQYGQPTEWERQETNQQTGRMFRKTYKVPMFIDPEDPLCLNRFEGICVVARRGTEKPGDIVFEGPPTIDMEPLDEEAEKETEAERHKWIDPVNSLPLTIGEEAGKAILQGLEQQVASIGLSGMNASLRDRPNPEIEALKAMVAQQQEMLAKLMGQMATKTVDEANLPPSDVEPVIDTEPPLPPDPDPEALPKPPPIAVKRPASVARR